MHSPSSTPQDASNAFFQIDGAIDSYLKKEISRYSMFSALVLTAICAGGAFLFKIIIENKLSELDQARIEISK